MTTGQAFGELALLARERRSATIVAETECDTWTISGDHYLAVLRGTFQRDMADKIAAARAVVLIFFLLSFLSFFFFYFFLPSLVLFCI